jgi:hypothetical protein
VTDILDTRWQVSGQAIANAVGEEIVVLHLGNGTYFGLDPVGAVLWNTIMSGDPPARARDKILEKYDIDRETVEQDLRRFLGELEQGDLITQT